MKAMVLRRYSEVSVGRDPLELMDVDVPEPRSREVLIRVSTCGLCPTDIDVIEGRVIGKLPV
ncbi:MAG: hypothetical protein QXE99_06900, partial [Acidilobaceae archaeon]